MKTREDELREMIDVVIKLVWNYTIFRALFEKNDADAETRRTHPEIFLTMHDSLLCGFCMATAILFEEKEKATSLWNLIKKSKPEIATTLSEKIQPINSSIKKIESLRHQVFAHRWQAKSPQDVLKETQLQVNMMAEIANLVQSIIFELAKEIDRNKQEELQRQQLSQSTLQSITAEVAQLMRRAFQ
jgi:AbiU2